MKPRFAEAVGVMVSLLFTCACGQQTAPPPTQTSGTNKKGQIVQPAVKPGKAADGSSLLITFHGCADLVLLDARGRKLGYDAALRKSFQQIPGGIYDEGDLLSDDEDDAAGPSKPAAKTSATDHNCANDRTLQVPQPMAGGYNLSVDNATGNPFRLEITSYGPDSKQSGHFVASRPARATGTWAYQFELPPGSGGLEVKAR